MTSKIRMSLALAKLCFSVTEELNTTKAAKLSSVVIVLDLSVAFDMVYQNV